MGTRLSWPADRHRRRPLRSRLEAAVADGYALVDQELEQGLRAVAVPILDQHSSVVAAMNVVTSAARRSVAAVRAELLPPRMPAPCRSRPRCVGGGPDRGGCSQPCSSSSRSGANEWAIIQDAKSVIRASITRGRRRGP